MMESRDPENYVSLHVHSDYSKLDSIAKVEGLVSKAKRLGMQSLALTDHGTISGWIKFYEECKKQDMKPIFGIEAYIVEDATRIKTLDTEIEELEIKQANWMPLFDGIMEDENGVDRLKAEKTKERKSNHVILLAKNEIGYRNIMKLSSWAYLNGYYYKPRIDLNILEKHKEGIIATSACLGGQISFNIMKGDLAKAEEYVQRYLKIFGEDFYIELQLHPVEEQVTVNKQMLIFAKKYNIKTVISQDVHYLDAEDVELHEIVIRLKNKEKTKTLVKEEGQTIRGIDIAREVKSIGNKRQAFIKEHMLMAQAAEEKNVGDSDGYFYNAREYYFKTYDEMKLAWKTSHDYITDEEFYNSMQNTINIADMVEKISAYSTVAYLPKINNDTNILPKDLLREIVKSGAKAKLGPKVKVDPSLKAIYEKRLKEELDVINDLGFEEYFLIVWDFIKWCRDNDISVGPGRGSVGGSLVAYVADLTKIDPIQHGLLFSRFINRTRSSAKYKLDFSDFPLEKK